jgi:hypothetical protein
MIPDDRLAGWLGSAAARTATTAAMAALALELEVLPGLQSLRLGVERAAQAGADALLALARSFIEDDSAIAGVIAAAVAAASADPFCRPPFRATRNDVQDGLLLFSHPALVVQLATMNADALAIKRACPDDRAPITFTGQRSLFRFLKGGGAVLSIWESPKGGGGRCRLRERLRLAGGESLEIDGRQESFVVESARSDLVYAFASTSLEAGDLATEYDPRTLEPVATSSTDDAGSRAQMMLALLRTMGRRDSAPVFAAQLQAGHFHARWQAMREFLALDAELALPHLQAMADGDPHDEVRTAAAETLAAFFREALSPCPA